MLKAKEVYLTDMCAQSVKLMRENIDLNKNMLGSRAFSVNYLEWGKHDIEISEEARKMAREVNEDKAFPNKSHQGYFDLILASDVIYFAGCLQPLADCMRHFLKPKTGRVLFVNDAARYEVFSDRFEVMLKEAGFVRLLERTDLEFQGQRFNLQIL